jgi:hypothetical protein
MEGLLFTLALLAALAVGIGIAPRFERLRRRYPKQTSEPPGERSAPDAWHEDGHGPPAP